MLSELDVLRDIDQRLERAGIAYMLTGSLALSYYAQPRMTRDIDLVISVEGTEPVALANVFLPEYYVSESDVDRALHEQGMFNVLHMESVIKVDLMVRKSGEYRRLEFGRRRRVELEGVPAWIVAMEDLILSKLVWAKDSHSEVQLRDVRALLEAGADTTYLDVWAPVLGVDKLLQEARA